MLDALKALFSKHAPPATGSTTTGAGAAAGPERGIQVAACALLLEIAHADDEFSPAERTHIEEIVRRHFDLDEESARQLMVVAEEARREAVDLHQFTALLSRHYDEGQRMVLAELLWRVVYADGELSKHESYLTRRLGNLLELRPGYLSEAKRRAVG